MRITVKEDFSKIKKRVQKKYPGAHTMFDSESKSYHIVDNQGNRILTEEYYLPPATSVRKAWEYIDHITFFEKAIVKSFNAFSDEKLNTTVAKLNKDDEEPIPSDDSVEI